MSESDVLLAVNGTLMRGLKLNPNMVAAKATFVREAMTEPAYRLWTINDEHPAMLRVTNGTGVRVAVEVWSVPPAGLAGILLNEPPGLCIGKVRLEDGSIVLGVLGEPALVEGHREITTYGGWRAYLAQDSR
ncbi:MAG: glutamyl-tRNA amidotransferase [Nitrospira sp.]|nr:glutamyl-tRNA amidotransferase [Nitrospira sp.]